MFVLAPGDMVYHSEAVKAEEPEAAGCIESAVRKKRAMNACAQLTH